MTEFEDHGDGLVGVLLRVGQAERHAPGDSSDDPSVDLEVFSEPLEVGDQVGGRVGGQVGAGTDTGYRAATATLVELDDPVAGGIE